MTATNGHGHTNSAHAWRASDTQAQVGNLHSQILSLLRDGAILTDREICEAINSPRFVSTPRVSELLNSGDLIECGQTRCKTTGKRVRLVRLSSAEERAQSRQREYKARIGVWLTRVPDDNATSRLHYDPNKATSRYRELLADHGCGELYEGRLRLKAHEPRRLDVVPAGTTYARPGIVDDTN